MRKEFDKLLGELNKTTAERDRLEVEYELRKSELYFSAEVNSFANQTMRDAQLTILLHQEDWDRKIAEARTNAKIAYYKWSTLKSVIDSGRD